MSSVDGYGVAVPLCPSGWYRVAVLPDGSVRCQSLQPCSEPGAVVGECNPYVHVQYQVQVYPNGVVTGVGDPTGVELPATGASETVGVVGAVLIAVGWVLLKAAARRRVW